MKKLLDAVNWAREERTSGWYLREFTNGLLIGGWVLLLILLSSHGNGISG